MNPERDVVNFWLNKNGFFTINDLNAGQNKVVDIIAIKQRNDKLESIRHVEIQCSISSNIPSRQEQEEIQKRFDDPAVIRTVTKAIKEYLGREHDYEKVLITTARGLSLKNIEIVDFSQVLLEVVKDMDKQNYRNATKRMLQLIKYLVIANPESLAKLVSYEGETHALKQNSREKFIRNLLAEEGVKKAMKKQANEKLLIGLLKVSTLKQPERLAKAMTEILSKRSYNKFLLFLFKQKEMKQFVEEALLKQQSSLEAYIK